jgi:hypothetical protein
MPVDQVKAGDPGDVALFMLMKNVKPGPAFLRNSTELSEGRD